MASEHRPERGIHLSIKARPGPGLAVFALLVLEPAAIDRGKCR